jgi:hypothetical protein
MKEVMDCSCQCCIHSRGNAQVFERGMLDRLQAAEMFQERLFAGRTNARDFLEEGTPLGFGSEFLVIADGEPVRFIPHLLDKKKRWGTGLQDNGIFPVGEKDALSCKGFFPGLRFIFPLMAFRQAYDADPPKIEFLERAARCAQLSLASVD